MESTTHLFISLFTSIGLDSALINLLMKQTIYCSTHKLVKFTYSAGLIKDASIKADSDGHSIEKHIYSLLSSYNIFKVLIKFN